MMTSLIDHLWQSTLVAAGAALLVMSLRPNGAKIRYWVWFAASVKFLIPFSALIALGAALGWPSASLLATEQEWTVLVERIAQPMAGFAAPLQEAVPTTAESLAPDAGIDIAALALGIWLLGTVVVLGAWLVRWVRLRRLVLAARPLRFNHVSGSIPVKATSSNIEPGVFGIRAPVIVVPEGLLERLSTSQLRAVIAHEVCHVRRRDNLTAAVHMLVEALFWFHPLVWWIGARMLDEREQACDEAVLAAGADRDAYAQGILEVCRYCIESPLPCAAGVGAAGSLKYRIDRIVRDSPLHPLGVARKAALSGVAAAVLVAPVGIGLLNAPRADAQPAVADEAALEQVTIETVEESVNPRLVGPFLLRAGGELMASHVPLRRLIAFAYDVDEPLVIGPPELDSRRYSINSPPGPLDYRQMMQNILTLRFGLAVHRETRTVPIFELVIAPSGASVPNGTPQPGRFVRVQQGGVTFNDAPIEDLRSWLSTRLGRPVVDRTGLTGNYTFAIAWGTLAEWDTSSHAVPGPEVLTRVLESQLGLSLIAAEGPIEVVMVDRVLEPVDSPPPEGTLRLGAAVLDRHVGFYGVPEIDWIVRVEREGEHLVVQINADRPHTVYPRSENVFTASVGDVEIEFVEEGGMRALVLHSGEVSSEGSLPVWGSSRENAYPMWGPRLDPATAEPLLADIEARFAAQTPVAGGDEIAARIARVLAGDEALPEDVRDPARAIHDALERNWPDLFAERGELVSVGFDAVNRMGKDVYEIAFEHLAFDVVLGLDPAAGTLTSFVYRVGAFPIVGGYPVSGDGIR